MILFFSFPSGKSGQKTFPSKRFLARGGQVEEGVTVATYRSTYFWEPVQHTNFTVTIVVKDGDKDETLDTQTIPSGKPKHHWKRCKLTERYWPTLCLLVNDWPYRSLKCNFIFWLNSLTYMFVVPLNVARFSTQILNSYTIAWTWWSRIRHAFTFQDMQQKVCKPPALPHPWNVIVVIAIYAQWFLKDIATLNCCIIL